MMTFANLKKLATKTMTVTVNEKYRTITFKRKGFGHIEATLSKDGETITARCTPNFKNAKLEYTFNERSYLHPVRFKEMGYADFRKLVTFLNNTKLDGAALPKPEPLAKNTSAPKKAANKASKPAKKEAKVFVQVKNGKPVEPSEPAKKLEPATK